MSYFKSLDISADQYRKIVPEFLRLLSKYAYSQAIIKSQVKLVKDDEIEVFSNISIKNILEKLTKLKFHSGKILIHHKNKKIHLTRSHYSQDVILELDFIPGSDLKTDLEKIFPKKKKISPAREAEELKKEAEIERKKELKDRKKELERIHSEEKEVFEKSKEAEEKLKEARRIQEKKKKNDNLNYQ